jgi:flavin reductase (DIM6/NTAB) family NADH-FMN oxidoreductase RutF
MNPITPEIYRSALGHYATGIVIVTGRGRNGNPVGMTANSFASVSLDPPLVLWSVDKSTPEADDFQAASHYAIHVLKRDQQKLSHRFAGSAIDKFADLSIENGIADLPLLDDYYVRLQCEIVSRHDEGDHNILVARVLDARIESAEPLVYFDGGYRRLEP